MNTQEVVQHNQSVYHQLEEGDLLEIKRRLYSHWAVYIGNNEVVHLAGEEDDGINYVEGKHVFTISGKTFNKALVHVDNFWDVVAGAKVHINNSKDRKWRPLPPAAIVERALSKVGRVGYNALYNNCEHFVSWCRYNVEKSDQVNSFFTGFFVGAAVLLTTGVVALLGGGKKERRRDTQF